MLFGQRMARDYNSSNKFYSYRLDRRGNGAAKTLCPFEWMGVCHGADLVYVFHDSFIKGSPEDIELSNEMMKAWTNFAKTGQPGSVGSIKWQQVYENGQKFPPSTMLLDVKTRMDEGIFQDLCVGFWEKIYKENN